MSPIEFAMLGLGFVALVAFILALCVLAGRVDALEADLSGLTDIVEKLVGDRVDDVTNAGCRSLNEVGRS